MGQKKVDNSVQSCSQPHESENNECNHSGLILSVNDLSFKTDETTKHKTVAIVAGNDKTRKDVELEPLGLVGPCATHTDKVFDAKTSNGDEKSDQKLKIKLGSEDPREFSTKGIKDFFWPKGASPKHYDVKCNTCGQNHSYGIDVYPDITWELEIGGKMEVDGNTGKTDFGFDAGIEAKYDGEQVVKFETGSSENEEEYSTIDTIIDLMYGTKKVVAEFSEFCSKGEGEFKLEHGVKLKANYGWEEVPGTPTVDHAVDLTLSLDPMLKIELSKDFAGPLLHAIPGVGSALAGIVWLMEKAKTGKLDLVAGCSGEYKADFHLMHIAGDATDKRNQVDIAGGIEFYMKFNAEVHVTVGVGFGYESRTSGKFEAGGKAKFGLEAGGENRKLVNGEDSVSAYMKFGFLGLYLYYIAAVNQGIAKSGSKSHLSTEFKDEGKAGEDDAPDDGGEKPEADKQTVTYKIIDAFSIVEKSLKLVK